MRVSKKKALGILSAMSLAVACMGVGAVTASADGVTGTMKMANGAQINLGSGYGGIRWITTIDADMWSAYADGAIYGTLIYPATVEDVTVENAKEKGAVIVWADSTQFETSNGTATFRSAISYDNIIENVKATGSTLTDEEICERAYSLELKAVSFIQTAEGDIEYAVANDTVRSARQVAIMADLKKDVDGIQNQEQKEIASARIDAYKLGEIKYGGAGVVYELQDKATVTTFEGYDGGEAKEVLVGAKKIANATVNGNKVTLPAGLDADLSGVDENGNVIEVYAEYITLCFI